MQLWLGMTGQDVEDAVEDGDAYWQAAAGALVAEEMVTELLVDCISAGVAQGITRAFKG